MKRVVRLAVMVFVVALFFSGCDAVGTDVLGRDAQIVILNLDNCTDVGIFQNGHRLLVVPMNEMRTLKLSRVSFSQDHEATLLAKSINYDQIPNGCQNWGNQYAVIGINGDYGEGQWNVQLEPPDWYY